MMEAKVIILTFCKTGDKMEFNKKQIEDTLDYPIRRQE